jgi:hypothetical protein
MTNILINSGIKLTIEPGVILNFGSCQLQVNGILNAQGTASNKIILSSSGSSNQKIDFTSLSSSWNDQTGSGCIISNAIIYSVPIIINGSSPRISSNYFAVSTYSPIFVNGGGPVITSNIVDLQYNSEIHVKNGNPTISSNLIKGGGQNYGIYTEASASASIVNNNITNCFSGIYAVGVCNIQQNNILNNANDGIRSNNSASSIQKNAIANNYCGIGGEGNILSNTITSNTYGLWGPTAASTISNNNIFSNSQNIHLTENSTVLGALADVNAVNNWWGTTETSVIDQTIWDFKNVTNLGTVTFVPFLNQANPLSPMIPTSIPIPTIPPTPAPATSTPVPSNSPNTFVSPTLEPTVPNYTTEPSPISTPAGIHTSSPPPETGNFSITDIENVAVIILSIALAISIIIVLNKKFSSSGNREASNKKPLRRKKSANDLCFC